MVSSHGRFLWYELATTDMEAAKAFYSKVMGWRTRDGSTHGMAYTAFTIGETLVSGVMPLSDDARRAGAQPHWIGYVGVDDVDATTDRIKRLGGTVRLPPTDIADLSRFSVVTDPQMATIGLFKWSATAEQQKSASDAPAPVGWHELLAADGENAWPFYGEMFGWKKGIADSGPMGTYQMFSAGGRTIGGIYTKPPEVLAPFWLYYFNVGDLDAAASRVQDEGGRILNGPIEVPDGSWIAQCTDPQNAMFALVGKRSYHAVGFLQRVAALK